MIEKPKRPKQPSVQERQPPRTLQELVLRYDLDNTEIYNYLDGLAETLNNKNVITVGISSSITLANTGQENINLNSIKAQIGDNLTLSNGKIYIGEGINHVLITGSIYTNKSANAGGACNALISKNGTNVLMSVNTTPSGAGNHTIVLPVKLESVEKGDYFELGYYGYSGDVVNSNVGTCITIEAID